MLRTLNVVCEPAEFFGFSAPRSIATRAFGSAGVSFSTRSVIVANSARWQPGGLFESSDRTALADYPGCVDAFLGLLVSEVEDRADRDRLDVLLPRSVFVDLADHAGADHITDLALGVGVASCDPVMIALQECFRGLGTLPASHGRVLAERLADALNTHLAERYGGMRKPLDTSSGGLAPWQLRLARRALNNLNSSTPLSDIADECGLSTGHFARAFKRSTGQSPHQWAVQRRIESAKEMLGIGVPLAEIAIACRFSDQSHLTRAFAQATGLTPGRWRSDRAMDQRDAII